MSYALLEKKIARVPEIYQQELEDFVDFLLSRPETDKNGLDEAIEEEKRGEVFYYDTVEDLLADVKNA